MGHRLCLVWAVCGTETCKFGNEPCTVPLQCSLRHWPWLFVFFLLNFVANDIRYRWFHAVHLDLPIRTYERFIVMCPVISQNIFRWLGTRLQ